MGINEVTVRRFRNKIWAQPDLLLELGLFEMVGGAINEEYRCVVVQGICQGIVFRDYVSRTFQ